MFLLFGIVGVIVLGKMSENEYGTPLPGVIFFAVLVVLGYFTLGPGARR